MKKTAKIDKQIYVTQPFLPQMEEFVPYLKDIWDSKWLTNIGKDHQRFEKHLPNFLVSNICPFSINKIQKIADTYGHEVIYDACHAFGFRTIKPNRVYEL